MIYILCVARRIMNEPNLSKRPKTILSIEDDPFYAELLSTRLRDSGYIVFHASTGRDGLLMAEREHPDLIYLDLMLPDMSGFDILQQLRSAGDSKDTPIIILSNLGDDENTKRGLALGATSYIVKSTTLPGEVVQQLNEAYPVS